jgi:hypothetical protein
MKQHFENIRNIIQAHVQYPCKVTVGVPPSGASNEIHVRIFNVPQDASGKFDDYLFGVINSIEDNYLVYYNLEDYVLYVLTKSPLITKKYYPEHYQE